MRQVAELFRITLPERLLAPAAELRHRPRDGVVEAEVQRLEVLGGDGDLLLDGRLGDGLADVAVVVDDLRDREPSREQLPAVQLGAGADGPRRERLGRGLQAQRLRELGQEQGEPMLQLFRRDGGPLPRRDLRSGARKDLALVAGDEVVKHDLLLANGLRIYVLIPNSAALLRCPSAANSVAR
jgi:hypothetical protein